SLVQPYLSHLRHALSTEPKGLRSLYGLPLRPAQPLPSQFGWHRVAPAAFVEIDTTCFRIDDAYPCHRKRSRRARQVAGCPGCPTEHRWAWDTDCFGVCWASLPRLAGQLLMRLQRPPSNKCRSAASWRTEECQAHAALHLGARS